MGTLLLVMTLVSIAAALAMGALAWRVTRDERLRSAARVAAIRAAADRGRVTQAPPGAVRERPLPVGREVVGAGLFSDGGDVPQGVTRQGMLAMASVVLLVVLAVAAFSMYADDRGAPAVADAAAPLELLTLHHERAGDNVNVSGLVRNPRSGHPVERLTAVVLLFDAQGGLLASGRAAVDYLRLGPGDDTPFSIALAAPPEAARYRVSFRTDAGIVPHVDRRVPVAAAAADVGSAARQGGTP